MFNFFQKIRWNLNVCYLLLTNCSAWWTDLFLFSLKRFQNDDPVLSANLLFVILPKVDQTECEIDFLGMYEVKDNEVCYGLRRGGRDACKVNESHISFL